MSVIDEAINKLTPEELDLLNSDSKMLSDFKAKYTTPQPEATPKFYEMEKQPGLPEATGDSTLSRLGNQLGGAAKDLGSAYLQGAMSPMPGSVLGAPVQAASNAANQFGADIARSTKDSLGTIGGRVAGLGASLAANPLSYMGGALAPEASITSNVPKVGFIRKALNLFKKGATPEEMNEAVGNVQDMVGAAKSKFGNLLNEAKSKLGLPTEVGDKVQSLSKYGNTFELDLNQPLKMAEQPIGATASHEGPSIIQQKFGRGNHMGQQLEQWATAYRDDPALALKNIDEIIAGNTNSGEKVGGWFPNKTIADQFKSELVSKLEKGEGTASFIMSEPSAKVEPFKLGEHAKPNQLVSEIENFTKKADSIDPGDRVKAASYLQDQINNHIDWNKKGDSVQGLLKQQYKDLQNVINSSVDNLQQAKSKMAQVFDSLNEIENKLQDPGQAEAFLKRIASNPTGKNADYLAKLKKLESLSGKETVDDLFKMFASEKKLDLRHVVSDAAKAGFETIGTNLNRLPRVMAGPIGAKLGDVNNNNKELQSLRDKLRVK